MLEHEVKLDDSDGCSQEEIQSGEWLLGDEVLKEQELFLCLEEKEGYSPNTCGHLLFYFILLQRSVYI